MKTLLAITASLLLSLAAEAKEGWTENFDEAKARAKAENKKILLDFTGSDWCGWCIKLDNEVFSQQEFKDYAAKNLVLVELDFPRRKSQSDEIKKQNAALAKKYKIQGYPTIVVLSSNGTQRGELGYVQGGPKAFIRQLEKVR